MVRHLCELVFGIGNNDLQAATLFNRLVVNVSTINIVTITEHGIALIAAMARKLVQADVSIKAGPKRSV